MGTRGGAVRSPSNEKKFSDGVTHTQKVILLKRMSTNASQKSHTRDKNSSSQVNEGDLPDCWHLEWSRPEPNYFQLLIGISRHAIPDSKSTLVYDFLIYCTFENLNCFHVESCYLGKPEPGSWSYLTPKSTISSSLWHKNCVLCWKNRLLVWPHRMLNAGRKHGVFSFIQFLPPLLLAAWLTSHIGVFIFISAVPFLSSPTHGWHQHNENS